MSSYVCRVCGFPGILDDAWVGRHDHDGICVECFKGLPEDEKVRVLDDIGRRRAEWSRPQPPPQA